MQPRVGVQRFDLENTGKVQAEDDDDYARDNRKRMLVARRYCPISVEIAPKVTNTTLNPRMNPTEFTITRRISCARGDLSSSNPTPEISDT